MAPSPWPRRILATALVCGVLESVVLTALVARLPPVPHVPLDVTADELVERVARIERTYVDAQPWLTRRLAPFAHFDYEAHRRDLLTPRGWVLENWTHARRVGRFNRTLRDFRDDYLATARMLRAVLVAGSLALLWLLLAGPSAAVALTVLLGGLHTTPILTEPVLGWDAGLELLPFVVPQLVAGSLALREGLRGAGAVVARLADRHAALVIIGACVGGGAAGVGLSLLGIDEGMEWVVTLGAYLVAVGFCGLLFGAWHAGAAWLRRRR